MKKFVFKTCLLFFASSCFLCCKHDKSDRKDIPRNETSSILLPSTSFDGSYKTISSEETKRGFEVNEDRTFRVLKSKLASKQMEFVYYFDDKEKYQVAMCEVIGNSSLLEFENGLKVLGFVLDNYASKNEKEKVFINNGKNIILASSIRDIGGIETVSYTFGKLDETVFSWTRTSTLRHESGLWLPLIAKGSSVDLMLRFESRLNHALSADSKHDKGVYIFETREQRFPKIKYWFDVENKAFLEEVAIFVNPDDRPTPQQVDSFLTANTFKLTPLKDNGNLIYYNKEMKAIAVVQMNKPTIGDFEPKIQFFYGNLDDKLPKEIIDMPIPVLEFGKITLDEALEKFKKELYYRSYEINAMGGYNIITTSEDFPKIWIDQDVGKYALACDIAKDSKVINSNDIVNKLNIAGFTEKKVGGVIETYIDRNRNVMAQIDRVATFGAECVAFSANEF